MTLNHLDLICPDKIGMDFVLPEGRLYFSQIGQEQERHLEW